MRLLDTKHQQAAIFILVLGIALVIAFGSICHGAHGIRFSTLSFPGLPGAGPEAQTNSGGRYCGRFGPVSGAVAGPAPDGGHRQPGPDIARGILESPLRSRLNEVEIGGYRLGPQVSLAGEKLVTWMGTGAIGLIGTATRISLNLTISLFGLFYLFLSAGQIWRVVEPYIPFSTENSEQLKTRFKLVTISTIIGTGLTAVIQGILIGLAFWVAGLSNALFWGVITVIVAILPVVGSGMIWVPAAILLFLDHRYVAAP